MTYSKRVRELHNRVWSFSEVCFDEQEKTELVNLLIAFGFYARVLCRTKEQYIDFVKEITEGVVSEENITPILFEGEKE